MYRLLFFSFLLLYPLILTDALPAFVIKNTASVKNKVLVIYSYHDTLPWQAKVRESLFNRLNNSQVNQRPEIFEERFEAHRLSDISSSETFLALLQTKYKNVKFDLIVTENDYAADFIALHPDFFAGVRRVTVSMNSDNDGEVFAAREDPKAAIETILRVMPNTQRIIAIAEKNDKNYNNIEYIGFKSTRLELAKKHITLDVWSDFNFAQLYQNVASISTKDTVILYFPVSEDNNNMRQIPKQVVEHLISISPVPIFAHHDSFLNTGIVGGYLISATKVGELIADIILGVKLPKTQAEIDARTKGYYFDANVLKRWQIDKQLLPEHSILINNETSVFYIYRWQISITLIALILESLLIFTLFRTLKQRNQVSKELAQQRDLLEQRVIERTSELAESRNLFREAAKLAKFGVFDYNPITNELRWDDSMFVIYSITPHQQINYQTWCELLCPEDRMEVEQVLQHAIISKNEFDMDFRIQRHNEIATIYILGQVYRDENGQAWRVVCFNQDITERKTIENHIHRLAFYDYLTDLPNRRLLYERLKLSIEQAHREHHYIAVMMMDLDKFKAVNDSLGHTAGDELLKLVATRINQRLRETDTLARLGGDEFTVILNSIRHKEDAGRIADSIINELSKPFQLSASDDVRIGTSIGISLYPEHGENPEKLLDHADLALYQAKKEGRGRFAYFSELLNHQVHQRIDLENRLRKAIEQQHLCVYYQAKVDINTDKIIGAEALVRWQDEQQGMIPPDQFISIAEESGLIVDIGKWVLNETCRQGKAWLDAGLMPLALAVNVSPYQFRHSNIVELVTEVLVNTGYPAEYLELELTESGLMKDQENNILVLNKLRAKGVTLAIDDFGTGYSSLAYLKKFPVNVLKIDKSFIDDIPCDQSDMEIAASIISMGHILGFKIVAEGVETIEQLNFLKDQECDIYQGYFKSKPLPAEKFMELITLSN